MEINGWINEWINGGTRGRGGARDIYLPSVKVNTNANRLCIKVVLY